MNHRPFVRIAAAVIAGATLSMPAVAEKRTLTLDGSGLQSLNISAGAGSLDIQGVDNSDRIEVIAEFDGNEHDYRLTLEKDGDRAVLVSELEGWVFWFWFGEWSGIDLTVKVPSKLALDIKDGSGEIEIAGMKAPANIRDGSGSIGVKRHRGSLDIHDGSGSIDIHDVTGKVRIDDGSGSLTTRNIIGDVDIDDGSGSIDVHNIDGHVTIRDGSGGIDVADVRKGLSILESGSGSVATANIEGKIDIDD